MKRWAGWIVIGVLALTLGALVIHPWSGNEIPVASEYSSPSDLARELNDHGLGCEDPNQPRVFKALEWIFIDRRLLFPETLVCSVEGRPVVLTVYPPASLTVDTNLQDAAAHGDRSRFEVLGIDAMLFGPNWMVMARQEHDSIPALSAIRDEIGGTLVVATSPTTPASSPTNNGPSP